jgi:hypothetical protein
VPAGAPADAPAGPSRRRRPAKQVRPSPGAALASWLGQRFLGWLVGIVSLVLLNLLVCGGYVGWTYLHLHHRSGGAAALPVAVSVARLVRDYQDDPATADTKYRGRMLAVTGTVDEVGQEGGRTWYVILAPGDGALRVQCFFDGADEDDAAEVARLQKGREVTVQGRCEGKAERIRLRECALAE